MVRQAAAIGHPSGGRLVLGADLHFAADDFVPFGEEWVPAGARRAHQSTQTVRLLCVMTLGWVGDAAVTGPSVRAEAAAEPRRPQE